MNTSRNTLCDIGLMTNKQGKPHILIPNMDYVCRVYRSNHCTPERRHLDFFCGFSASAAALEGCSWIDFHTRGTFPVSLINSIGLAGGRGNCLDLVGFWWDCTAVCASAGLPQLGFDAAQLSRPNVVARAPIHAGVSCLSSYPSYR
jgi:hypothetical protein